MASKQEFTQEELIEMSKAELIKLAESLHITTQSLNKRQLIKQILGQPISVTTEPQVELEHDPIEVFTDTVEEIKSTVQKLGVPQPTVEEIKITAQKLGVPQPTNPQLQFLSEAQIKYNLELKRLEFEERERERKAKMESEERKAKIEFEERKAKMESEERKAKMEFDLRALEINSRARPPQDNQSKFTVETAAKLLPKLGSEHELEIYLITFRKIATLNNWPKEWWSAILQTQLKGKAMRIFAELPDTVIGDFDQLQASLLAAYELSPEHYRKKFRDIRKSDSENYVDFAFKMQNFFKRWLQSLSSYDDVDKLRQTLLMEQFLQTVSVELKIWLVDQKPKTIDDMARLADQYVALRKQTTSTQQPSTDAQKVVAFNKDTGHKSQSQFKSHEHARRSPSLSRSVHFRQNRPQMAASKPVICAYCKKPNHTISECWKLKNKQATDKSSGTSSVNANSFTAITKPTGVNIEQMDNRDMTIHPLFTPYCKPASIVRIDGSVKQIQTLRDTGAMQSLLKDTHNRNDYITTDETRQLKGITTDTMTVPLVQVHLRTDFIDETVLCGLVDELPDGIDFLIGNDIWLKAHPLPYEVIEQAVVTRSQARKAQNSFDVNKTQQLTSQDDQVTDDDDDHLLRTPLNLDTSIDSVTDRTKLINLQKADANLAKIRKECANNHENSENSYFFLRDDMLMHHFSDRKTNFASDRIVVPSSLRLQILQLAHDIPAAGHLGIRKTHSRLQPHFYWPRMLKDVTHFCKSCDICQREGKGRKLPPAPLISVPLMSDPWSRIAIDIVGPLPVCPKTGNRFLLTCIDLATHYPEAIPIKQHTAEEVANALAQIFSHFGFPEEILSDQGTEFMSELMQHFLFQFGITQIRSSPYHPETNGSCERFHRTLKSMLRSMVDDFNDSWTECLPWTLFAYREIPVETLGFSPFELINGYPIRGPHSLVRTTWSQNPVSTNCTKRSVLQYMLDMRERIAKCTELATSIAEQAKTTSKTWYDRKTRSRKFDEGDLVLVLLPVTGKPLQCKYQGPYKIVRQLGPVDYIIATPDKRKTERTCHVNMLKPYVQRQFQFTNSVPSVELLNSCSYDTDTDTVITQSVNEAKCDNLSTEQRAQLQNVPFVLLIGCRTWLH